MRPADASVDSRSPRLPRGGELLRARDPAVVDALRHGAWVNPPRLVKRESEACTWLGELSVNGRARGVVLKRIPERRGIRRLLHRIFANSPAFRQWRGAEILRAHGVPTSRPIALVRKGGFEWLTLEAVAGEDALRRVHRMRQEGATVRDQHALALALGELVRALASAGVRNRDHKLSNVIVAESGDLAVIDTVGVSKGAGGAERMLYAMVTEAEGVGLLPRCALLMRALRSSGAPVKSTWRSISDVRTRDRDLTPRVDPLQDAKLQ